MPGHTSLSTLTFIRWIWNPCMDCAPVQQALIHPAPEVCCVRETRHFYRYALIQASYHLETDSKSDCLTGFAVLRPPGTCPHSSSTSAMANLVEQVVANLLVWLIQQCGRQIT